MRDRLHVLHVIFEAEQIAETEISKKVKEAFDCDGLDVYECNNRCAGQSVFHMHIHVFPRKKGDKLFNIYNNHDPIWLPTEEVMEYKERLSKHLDD